LSQLDRQSAALDVPDMMTGWLTVVEKQIRNG
jgi:hypothetical protein